jgi:hypothetical protein
VASRTARIAQLRAALEQRAAQRKAELRDAPQIARMLLRRLIGPLTLWDAKDQAAFVEWQAEATARLLDGLAPTRWSRPQGDSNP